MLAKIKKIFSGQIEDRAGGSFGNEVLAFIQANAENAVTQGRTSAIEVAAGWLSRALEGCRVDGPERLVGPVQGWLCQAGRDLIRDGETAALVRMSGGSLKLLPVGYLDWERGTADPDTWLARCTLYGPHSSYAVLTRRDSICWIPWATDSDSPYAGQTAAQFAASGSQLDARIENSLSQEANATVATLIPLPTSDNISQLRADLIAAKGGLKLVETVAAGWGEGVTAAPKRDWMQSKLGPDAPAPIVELYKASYERQLATYGLSPALFSGDADGTSKRESMRQAALSVLFPIGKRIERELRMRLDDSITLTFDSYWIDLQGRSSAYANLTDAKLDAETARGIVGL